MVEYQIDLRDVRDFFFFQAEDGIRDGRVTGVQTCALPILVTSGTASIGSLVRDQAPDTAAASVASKTSQRWRTEKARIRSSTAQSSAKAFISCALSGNVLIPAITSPDRSPVTTSTKRSSFRPKPTGRLSKPSGVRTKTTFSLSIV